MPLQLTNLIPEDFCLDETPVFDGPAFDVCLCYRQDTDKDSADVLERTITDAGLTVFTPGTTCNGVHSDEMQSARAVCSSSVVGLIISDETFGGIDTLADAGPASETHQLLAKRLQQMEIVLENV
jgi:hypothetical protein